MAANAPSGGSRSNDEFHPATPPNEKTGASYAQAAARPHIRPSAESSIRSQSSLEIMSPPQSYADVVEKPPSEGRRRRRTEQQVDEDQVRLEQEKAERRRRRREREERERIESERYEAEKQRRRAERRQRPERERPEPTSSSPASPVTVSTSGKDTFKTVKTGEDAVSDGGREGTEKPSLVTAIQKVHWAPLNIPLPRRLQTAAVLWHTLSMTICFSIFWFVLAIPLSWPLLVPYLVYVFFFAKNHTDGSAPYKRSEFLRNLPIWRLYTEYFPMRLHRTAELDPTKNYIFAYHPHGIISHGAFGNFCTEATGFKQLFPGIKNTLLTIDTNFQIPFNREYLLAMGLASVSKRSCEALLRGEGAPKKRVRSLWQPTTWFVKPSEGVDPAGNGRAITIVIGGASESLEAHPGRMKLVCKKRKGFLKLAMREGAGVVPVLSFGENDLYEQIVPGEGSWIHRMQMGLKKTLGFTIPLIHARGVFNYDVGLMPYRHEINTVVGAPIFPPRTTAEPTDQEVAEFQKRYIEELQRLWEEWKDVFAKDRKPGLEGELEIIE